MVSSMLERMVNASEEAVGHAMPCRSGTAVGAPKASQASIAALARLHHTASDSDVPH